MRSTLRYRDKNLGQYIIGLVALGMGSYLAFLFVASGIPKLIQAPPQGNDWFVAIPIFTLFISVAALLVGVGLFLLFLQRGATFFTEPLAVETWQHWFKWKWVRSHPLDGYDTVEIRWNSAKHTYFYLVLRSRERPDVEINTFYSPLRSDIEAMSREVADFLGWNRADPTDAVASPNSDVGTT